MKSNEIINKIHSLNPTAFFLDNKDRTALGQRLISTLVNLVTLSSLAHSTKLNNQIISLSTASTMLCSLVFTLLSYQQSTHPPTKNRGSLRRTPQPWSSSSLLRLVRVIQREADIIHREIENLDKKLSSFSYLSNPTHHICQLFEKSLLDHLHLLVDALSNLPLRNPRDIYISYDKAQLQLASMSTCILPEKNHEIPCLLTSRSYSKAESTGALKKYSFI
ncbi:hypothetical protein BDF14DRAFT_1739967 [Spinellus fusiger]|nr:hypothetical protein BDF14DRAFT_1739967 [Spinellus fusiger]